MCVCCCGLVGLGVVSCIPFSLTIRQRDEVTCVFHCAVVAKPSNIANPENGVRVLVAFFLSLPTTQRLKPKSCSVQYRTNNIDLYNFPPFLDSDIQPHPIKEIYSQLLQYILEASYPSPSYRPQKSFTTSFR